MLLRLLAQLGHHKKISVALLARFSPVPLELKANFAVAHDVEPGPGEQPALITKGVVVVVEIHMPRFYRHEKVLLSVVLC